MQKVRFSLTADPADFRKYITKRGKTMGTTNIGADAAKLAGLQIDTLQKVRSGQITIDQWERFNKLSKGDREVCFGNQKKPEFTKKFALLVDLGIITVPDDYDHATALDKFLKENRKNFYDINNNITDANFPNPTRILKPGDKLRVRAYKQIVDGTTSSKERMTFLATHKAVYTGAQGILLVFEQRRDQMPKCYRYISFDEPNRLIKKKIFGPRAVPIICAYNDGRFCFYLYDFQSMWHNDHTFLCFNDVESESSVA